MMSVATIVLVLFLLVGLPVLVLWVRDHTGAFGRVTIGYGIALISLAFGLIVAGWIVYNVFFPTSFFRESIERRMQFGVLSLLCGFLVPGVFIWYGIKYIFHPGAGIEEQNIDFDAPELVAAKQQAQASLGHFAQKAAEHVDGAFIKFPLVTAENFTEHIWGYVHHYGNGTFNVSVANDTIATGEHGMRIDVPETDVEDWQLMLPDGTIKGGFSIIGAFRYYENNGRKLNKTMQRQKAALLDFDRPAPAKEEAS